MEPGIQDCKQQQRVNNNEVKKTNFVSTTTKYYCSKDEEREQKNFKNFKILSDITKIHQVCEKGLQLILRIKHTYTHKYTLKCINMHEKV